MKEVLAEGYTAESEVFENEGMEEVLSPVRRSPAQKFRIWFHQNRFQLFGTMSVAVQGSLLLGAGFSGPDPSAPKEVYEEIAFVSDLQVESPEAPPAEAPADGELEMKDKLDEPKEDPRIASAKNPFVAGANLPVDLTPSLIPSYTAEARAAGVEGILYLEIVIADTGELIFIKPKNHLGFGLEEAAMAIYRRKKYKPAILEGEPITVRLTVPVRYTLE